MDTSDWSTAYFFWYLAGYGLVVALAWWGRRRPASASRGVRVGVGVSGGLVLLAGAGLLVGEAYFLFGYDSTDAFGFLRSTRRWFDRHVVTNTIGVRDPEWDETPERGEGVYRIGVLGDEFTFGQGIEDPADRFTDRLGARLNARGDSLRYMVLNIALPKWDTRTHVGVSRDLVPYLGLDELVLAYNLDDARDLTYVPETLQLIQDQRPGWSRALAERSMLFDFVLTRTLVSRGLGLTYGLLKEAYETQRHSAYQITRIREVKSVADRLDIPMRVVILPLLAEEWDRYTFAAEHPRLRAKLEGYGMDVLDLLDVYRGIPSRDLWAGPLDPHPNERAHALAADAIYNAFYQP